MTELSFQRVILDITSDESATDIVSRLIQVKDQIRESARKRSWQRKEINRRRWQNLEDLLDRAIHDAKEDLARSLIQDIRTAQNDNQLDTECCQRLKAGIWQHLGVCRAYLIQIV